jgi:hypothetical protein
MNHEQLEQELRGAGIALLAVSPHAKDPDVAVVYLHGAMGQWIDSWAVNLIRSIPGVRTAESHVRTPAIVLVWMNP